MDFSYSVQNLRRIKSMPAINIRPLTILVGRNSAGKSTFLRTFPLMKQSLVTRSSAPVLWYGDYVDFGDFATSVSNGNIKDNIVFSFEFKEFEEEIRSSYRSRSFSKVEIEESLVKVSYHVATRNEKTILSQINIEMEDEGIFLEIDMGVKAGENQSILVNGKDVLQNLKARELYSVDKKLFSPPMFFLEKKREGESRYVLEDPMSALKDRVISLLRFAIPNNVSENTIERQAAMMLNCRNLEQSLETWVVHSSTQAFRRYYSDLLEAVRNKKSRKILRLRGAFRSFAVLKHLETSLSNFFSEVRYLEPARVRSERYYRKQELEISEISPDGRNFPMFLASLSRPQLSNFSTWVQNIYGYGVKLKSSSGHSSIYLTVGDREVNVTDTGYGVSQLLPVLAQIWWASFSKGSVQRRNRGTRTLAIEQPELHLHPAHQALLADVFAKTVTEDSSFDTRLVIETHSEALINRLGELIEEGQVPANKVQIIVFGASNEMNSPTNISVAEFNEKGTLENWPFGFFNY